MNDQALKICITLLDSEQSPTDSHVNDAIFKVNKLFMLSDNEKEHLKKHLLSLFGIFSNNYKILDKSKDYIPWVKSSKGQNNWPFWNRYHLYMQQKVARDTLNKLDNLTDDILDRIGNPAWNGAWDKRGLVVGQVQSGKTGNYIGLINKAADTGYKLIVILAGMHDSLRSQTQIRVDEGFLGYNTQRSLQYSSHYFIGVSKYNPSDPLTGKLQELPIHSLTSGHLNGDFNQIKIQGNTNLRGSDPIVAVIKKNSSILKNLILWLSKWGTKDAHGKLIIQNLPILVIDDEADNASINVSKEKVSTINGHIRALLNLFEQSAYIGYTATPFANVFIPLKDAQNSKGLDITINDFAYSVGDDLFPEDFIINIPPPSNYIGPVELFGLKQSIDLQSEEKKPLPLIRDISLFDKSEIVFIPNKHKKNGPLPDCLPESLIYAIKCFILNVAARKARNQVNVHNSMLIHVTRFIRWQDHISFMIDNQLKVFQRQIDQRVGSIYDELKAIWESDFLVISRTIMERDDIFTDPGVNIISWEELVPHIHNSAMSIEVRAVHGDKNIAELQHNNILPLDYFVAEQKGSFLNIIAVGGDKLSRGLTLEGLSISYYLRASKMYDTLMQMGRWFGYRPGYSDLCRIFTTEELISWYRHITIASEEMRSEFDNMFHLRRSPKDYGLKVRTHPGVLKITAANKFRYHIKMSLSYSGGLAQTYEFDLNEKKIKNNYSILVDLIKSFGSKSLPPNKENKNQIYFYGGVNNSQLITSFLRNYQINPKVIDVQKIANYIEAQSSLKYLVNWSVLIIHNSIALSEMQHQFPFHDKPLGLTDRTNQSENIGTYLIGNSNISDSIHELSDLNDEQILKAQIKTNEDFFEDLKNKPEEEKRAAKPPNHPSRLRIRQQRPSSNGLLIIYPLNPSPFHLNNFTGKKGNRKRIANLPIIGFAISFPELNQDNKIEYAVNEQFLKEFEYPEELDRMQEDE